METDHIAQVSTTVRAPVAEVWDALVQPGRIKQYMFGAEVVSEWKVGKPISWKGVWQGKPYEDKGVILQIVPRELLQYSHYSPLTGEPDLPENYHTVTIELQDKGADTFVSLAQDNNASEQDREHSEKMWASMLEGMKKMLEK